MGSRKSAFRPAVAIVLLAVAVLSLPGASRGNAPISPKFSAATSRACAAPMLTNLGLGFEPNVGQTDARVRYLARGSGYTLFLTQTEAVFALAEPVRDWRPSSRSIAASLKPASGLNRAAAMRIGFVGANPKASVRGIDRLPGRDNYFVGNDSKHWHPDVPTYDRTKYTGIYPGIDLIFYGSSKTLECDFVVAPGANPNWIRLALGGGDARIDRAGNLLLRAGSGNDLTLKRPMIYQPSAGREKRLIDGRYVLSASKDGAAMLSFAVASYDSNQPLVIDPQITYAAWLGGPTLGIAVDSKGLVYVAGTQPGPEFPFTAGAFQTTPGFLVSVLNPAASASAQLVYSTTFGPYVQTSNPLASYATSSPMAIAADSMGRIYLVGEAEGGFPTTAGAFGTQGPQGNYYQGFFTVLDPNLSGDAQLAYSTYLDNVGPTAVAVDSKGLAYIVGYTYSPDLPLSANAFQTVFKAKHGPNVYVAVLDPSASGNEALV
jgi:hypothetical protein